jgi:hypothetical protein
VRGALRGRRELVEFCVAYRQSGDMAVPVGVGKSIQHGEERLVIVNLGPDAARCVERQLWTCLAEPGFVLGGREDGDVEDLACPMSVCLG